jgi:GNAT superfamily N-acetyltransferase
MTATDTMPGITRATPDQAKTIAKMIGGAFRFLPAATWLVAAPEQRPLVLAAQFHILVEHALQYGHIDVLDDGSGAAVWFDRTLPMPDPPDYHRRLRTACGPWTGRFAILDDLFSRNHPPGPHHYLAFLAVEHRVQGTGRGGALLRHHHGELDRLHVSAYLEASSEPNTELYRRLGYELGTAFYLPAGPPFWPMWREPRRLVAA